MSEIPYKVPQAGEEPVLIEVKMTTVFWMAPGTRILHDKEEGRLVVMVPSAELDGEEVELEPLLTLQFWNERGDQENLLDVTQATTDVTLTVKRRRKAKR